MPPKPVRSRRLRASATPITTVDVPSRIRAALAESLEKAVALIGGKQNAGFDFDADPGPDVSPAVLVPQSYALKQPHEMTRAEYFTHKGDEVPQKVAKHSLNTLTSLKKNTLQGRPNKKSV